MAHIADELAVSDAQLRTVGVIDGLHGPARLHFFADGLQVR